MTEREFWDKLEVRVRREFAGLKDKKLRRLCVDGFNARSFFSHELGTRIVGQVWTLPEDGWDFELIVRRPIEAWEDGKWEELLPGEDVTGWMWMDFEGKVLRIDPAVAYPDKTPQPDPLP